MPLLPNRATPSDGPRLWKIWIAIPAVVVGGLLLASVLGALLWVSFGQPPLGATGWNAQTQLETVRLSLVMVGGIGGVVALVVAYRKQRITEAAEYRENSKHFNERFLNACAELGNEAAAVRLAAVYAVARLADDWRPERQTCIDVLCAYLRLPYQPDRDHPHFRHGEREVRLSVIRLIRDHLRKGDEDAATWRGYDFDFTEAVFDGGDFSAVCFSSGMVSFRQASFPMGAVSFDEATFSGATVDFTEASFAGGRISLQQPTFSGGVVSFVRAKFSASAVTLTRPTFCGSEVHFDWAILSGGEVNILDADLTDGMITFHAAVFSGSHVDFRGSTFGGGAVQFTEAIFTSGVVSFHQTNFTGSDVGFHRASFAGGQVNLRQATVTAGEVSFIGATFAGEISFDNANFAGGRVRFLGATFADGESNFFDASFSGAELDFRRANFSGGEVNFDHASFTGSAVDFFDASFTGSQVSFAGAAFADGTVDLTQPKTYDHPPTFDPEIVSDVLKLPAGDVPPALLQRSDLTFPGGHALAR